MGFAIAWQAREQPATTALQRTSGEQAPAIRLPDRVDPQPEVQLSDARGLPVVLSFWASWCVPCRNGMPAIVCISKSGEVLARRNR